jgi:hypothetical protein
MKRIRTILAKIKAKVWQNGQAWLEAKSEAGVAAKALLGRLIDWLMQAWRD